VAAAAVLFVILQVWLVWPHFKEWGQVKAGLEKSKRTVTTYQTEIARTNEYQAKLSELAREGTGLLVEERAQPNALISYIQSQAAQNKLNFGTIRPAPKGASIKANQFFEEQTIDLSVNPTGDKELVDFLVAMANSDLMIRVKELSLNPDPGGYKLMGNMKLIASFQKKNPTGAAPAKPGVVKPATLSAAKP